MSKYWRVIEYEATDDAAGATWIERTLASSINGTYRLPNGCRITACGAALCSEDKLRAEGLIYSEVVAALPRAREKQWEPPVRLMSLKMRQQFRGDVASASVASASTTSTTVAAADVATVMIAHVAAADDCRAPFDWSEHEESADCWCQPEVEEKQTTESDHDYRDRIAATFDGWGALLSELLESNGSALEEFGAYRGVARECKTVVTYVHRRPIDRGLDGRPRVMSRWDVGA